MNRSGDAVAVRETRPRHVTVGIATTGRRDVLRAVLPLIGRQSRLPDEIVICGAHEDDVDGAAQVGPPVPVRVVLAERGLCRQRNRILAEAARTDILLFLDDDFLMAPDYIGEAEAILANDRDIVMCTGLVEADGITGPGIALAEGLRLIDRAGGADRPAREAASVYNAYGCNMAVRMAAVRASGARFDENLPLYGWLEDVDFSRQMARHGRIVRAGRLRGVHLGTKMGRTSGVRFGYSQIANPVYLVRKRTMSVRHAGVQMGRNLLANAVKVAAPEPWVDRRGRFRGNLRALRDLLAGRLAPQNVLALE